jgi:hypothetical protein
VAARSGPYYVGSIWLNGAFSASGRSLAISWSAQRDSNPCFRRGRLRKPGLTIRRCGSGSSRAASPTGSRFARGCMLVTGEGLRAAFGLPGSMLTGNTQQRTSARPTTFRQNRPRNSCPSMRRRTGEQVSNSRERGRRAVYRQRSTRRLFRASRGRRFEKPGRRQGTRRISDTPGTGRDPGGRLTRDVLTKWRNEIAARPRHVRGKHGEAARPGKSL